MFADDLSPMPNGTYQYKTGSVAIGWLDIGHPFSKGVTSPESRLKLGELCRNPVRRTRGFHTCPFCIEGNVRGNGEIHVVSSTGEVFVAPALIWHYVVVHDYRPPDQFIEAVNGLGTGPMDIGKLTQAILTVADEPSSENERAFHEVFIQSRVGVRVSTEFGFVPSGNYITTCGNRVSIPLARLPDGKPMLLVLADVDKLSKLEAATVFVEFDAKDVREIAINAHAGIIVQTWLSGRSSWAGISEKNLRSLLEGKSSG
jgi:hypothetical protein